MNVLMINGSPHERGCTYTALSEIGKTLRENGVDYEIVSIGSAAVHGCMGCGACSGKGRCRFDDDPVNSIIEKAASADGFVFGSPVHYAAPAGILTTTLDRCFFAGGASFRYKPGAAVVSCRRAGSTAALDRLNKYFTISHMPIVSSGYWNMVHGSRPEEVMQDLEGLQIMRMLGVNMAWLLKCIEAGNAAGAARPVPEQKVWTNFIR